jgi:Bacteriodetes cell division protein (FtsL-like)
MNGIYSILKARFLINEDATATKNWRFIVFLIFLAIIMIGNTQRFEQKVMRIIDLTNQVKELRSEFVNSRSELMKLKMESTITTEMEATGIAPAQVPPVKIKVDKKQEDKNFVQKILD